MVDKILGKRVLNNTGTIIGLYSGQLYYDTIVSKWENPKIWDGKYPDWREKYVLIVDFDEPCRVMSAEEVGDYFGVPETFLSEKLYEYLSPKRKQMTVPYDEIFNKVKI